MNALDNFILARNGLTNAINFLSGRRSDYTSLLAQSPIKMDASVALHPTVRIALMDNGPGQRVTVATVGPTRVELIVDEEFGPGSNDYTTEVYIINDVRQAFAWFLAKYW